MEYEVYVDGIHLEPVSEYKYLGCVLDKIRYRRSIIYSREVAGTGRRVAGSMRSLVNARDLQLECARILHETLLVPVLMYDSETMLWKEK